MRRNSIGGTERASSGLFGHLLSACQLQAGESSSNGALCARNVVAYSIKARGETMPLT
jgi:hypothetical protein